MTSESGISASRPNDEERPAILSAEVDEWKPSKLASVLRPTYRFMTATLPSRGELPELLNRRQLVGSGAEIGVKLGLFSEHLLREWDGKHLLSVDPWLSELYVDLEDSDQDEQEMYYRQTIDRLRGFGERSTVWRLTSVEAAQRVADRTLDFVYIDARHDHASVLEDLQTWFPKVRLGGVIAGHDYLNGVLPEGDFGVKSAVDEFFGAHGLPVYSTYQDTPWISWVADVAEKRRAWPSRALEAAARSTTLSLRRVRRAHVCDDKK